MKLTIAVPEDFSFRSTVFSHGWCALPPFKVLKDSGRLRSVFTVPGGPVIAAEIYQDERDGRGGTSLKAEILPGPSAGRKTRKLTLLQQRQFASLVRTCLRADEGLDEFHSLAHKLPEYRWVTRKRAGRMMRSQTVFEDVVKMMCTTNCSWALTTAMVTNLCRKLGTGAGDGEYSFPDPTTIAACSEKTIRKEIRAGYRAPYLLEFSEKVAAGKLDPEKWRTSPLPTGELFEEVRTVKGIGPYAAGNILKLLGRYDYLGIDSWCRKKYSELHARGRSRSDKHIEKHYAPFGKWRGLFFWMDMTKEWYRKDFPF